MFIFGFSIRTYECIQWPFNVINAKLRFEFLIFFLLYCSESFNIQSHITHLSIYIYEIYNDFVCVCISLMYICLFSSISRCTRRKCYYYWRPFAVLRSRIHSMHVNDTRKIINIFYVRLRMCMGICILHMQREIINVCRV